MAEGSRGRRRASRSSEGTRFRTSWWQDRSEPGTPIYIVNGNALASMSGIVDVAAVQPAVVPSIVKAPNHFPTDWAGYGGMSLIIDSNKDGYADFAIGEFAHGKVGRVVVFY